MKAKVSIVYEFEYEINPKFYPDGLTVEEMLAIDKENFEDDPFTVLDDKEPKVEITEVK